MSQKHKLKAPFLLCHSAKSHEKVYSSSMSHEEVYFLDALASLDLKLSVSESVIYRTPSLVGRQCWGKTILPRAGYGLGTYRTVDIFNFSLIS